MITDTSRLKVMTLIITIIIADHYGLLWRSLMWKYNHIMLDIDVLSWLQNDD